MPRCVLAESLGPPAPESFPNWLGPPRPGQGRARARALRSGPRRRGGGRRQDDRDSPAISACLASQHPLVVHLLGSSLERMVLRDLHSAMVGGRFDGELDPFWRAYGERTCPRATTSYDGRRRPSSRTPGATEIPARGEPDRPGIPSSSMASCGCDERPGTRRHAGSSRGSHTAARVESRLVLPLADGSLHAQASIRSYWIYDRTEKAQDGSTGAGTRGARGPRRRASRPVLSGVSGIDRSELSFRPTPLVSESDSIRATTRRLGTSSPCARRSASGASSTR